MTNQDIYGVRGRLRALVLMPERDIVVFVEEQSAYEIVRAMARKLDLDDRLTVLKHRGAGDLERSFARKIASDPLPNSKFLVLRDADNKNCKTLKRQLGDLIPRDKRAKTIVRIVCQELEAWYLAQPEALRAAGALHREIPKKTLSGNVDAVANPKRIFLRHAHNKGQIEHARRIGEHLDFGSTKSASFMHFVLSLRSLAAMR